jgi:hypothetical protein
LGLFLSATPTRKAQQVTKKDTTQHDQQKSSTELTTKSGH